MKHPDQDIWLASFWKEKDGIESLDTYIKITVAEYCALCKKGAPRAIPMMCVLTIKKNEMMNPLRAKSCILVLGNHKDRFWTKPKNTLPIYVRTACVWWSAWQRNIIAHSNKATTKMLSVRAFYQMIKLQSLNLQSETQTPQRTNTGSLNGHSMGYNTVLATGTPRSMPLSTKLVSRQTHLTPFCTLVTSLILPTLVPPLPHPHLPLVCTWMTLFISWKIPRLNGFLNLYSLHLSRSTLWAQWNGF